ncbi:MAG: hypothetical protein JOZ16_07430, partial [Methylobacteriaceae bacterium]|nr:hypothetical protein [Methylobacteriaceae bacterium]
MTAGPTILETIVVTPNAEARAEEFRFAWHLGFWTLILAFVILCIWLLSG